jgi:hypothetical protein
VEIQFAWSQAYGGFEGTVLADLRAGFRGREIDVCATHGGPNQAPLASVRIASSNERLRVINVEILDTVTHKRVSRDIDLTSVPSDGQAFAIALATDELVWASWAELALERRQRPAPPAPPEVERGIRRELPIPAGDPIRLAAHAAGEHFAGGQEHLGADAAVIIPLHPDWHLSLGLGLREGLDVDAPHGVVRSNATAIASGIRYLLVDGRTVELTLGLSARLAWVRLHGRARPQASSSELSRAIVYARGGINADFRVLGPAWLGFSILAGAPLRALEATDAGRVVTGASGLELGAQAGVVVEL